MYEPNENIIEDSCEIEMNTEEVRFKDIIILEFRA